MMLVFFWSCIVTHAFVYRPPNLAVLFPYFPFRSACKSRIFFLNVNRHNLAVACGIYFCKLVKSFMTSSCICSGVITHTHTWARWPDGRQHVVDVTRVVVVGRTHQNAILAPRQLGAANAAGPKPNAHTRSTTCNYIIYALNADPEQLIAPCAVLNLRCRACICTSFCGGSACVCIFYNRIRLWRRLWR